MKILITGGAGYIGTELIAKLNTLPDVEQITVYDNLSRGNYNLFLDNKLNSDKLQFVNGDILDSRKLRKNVEGKDVVYHLAAKVTTPFANVDSHYFEQINHWGTAELADACEKSSVKKFIYAGSTAVYGNNAEGADETTIAYAQSFYGVSKSRAEEQVRRLIGKMQTLILRCANVYGYSPSMRFDGVINRFMFEANFNKRISINGSGKQTRPFIHIDKVVKVFTDALYSDIPSGVYNVSDLNLPVLEIVETLVKVYPETEYVFSNHHIQIQDLRIADTGKLSKHITFTPSDLYTDMLNFRDRFSFYSGK